MTEPWAGRIFTNGASVTLPPDDMRFEFRPMPMRITSFRYFPAEEDAGCKWEMDAEPVPGAPAATVTLRADWNAPAPPSFDLAERGEQP